MHPSLGSSGGLLRARLSSAFDESVYRTEAARSNADLIPRPLAITLQTPASLPAARERWGYVERLTREIEQVARLFDRDRDVLALHFDGGAGVAPQWREVEALVGSLERNFHFGATTRRLFSIRIDPGTVQADDFDACASLGFHCVDIDATGHDLATTVRTIELARGNGLLSACVEWPVAHGGLPDALLAARPDRIGCLLPEGSASPASLGTVGPLAAALAQAGYADIGLDPRPLPWIDPAGPPLLNGIARDGRWRRPEPDVDVIGLGAGALSRIRDSVCQNHLELGAWEAALDAAGLPVWRGLLLEAEDRLRMDVAGELLRTGEIGVAHVEQRFAIDFNDHFERELQALAALPAGLVDRSPNVLRATSQGRLMLRIMAECFDIPGQRPPP
ncbi:MAG: hypothetical protein AB7P31_09355 [Steroidobacteraceae bacterium]